MNIPLSAFSTLWIVGATFYAGEWLRLDFGAGNPNIAAAVFVPAMLAVWALSRWRWGFWVALLANAVLGVMLVLTFSRGGLLALICGGAVLLLLAIRGWNTVRTLAWVAVFGGLIGFSMWSPAADRLATGVKVADGSSANRIMVWKTTPRMMVDAPGGWGRGRAADAFMQWYEPTDRLERYLNLLNSHLHWMVERGWLFRACYVFSWLLVFRLCLGRASKTEAERAGERILFASTFAAWLGLALCASFTHVAERWYVWPVPVLMLLLVCWTRFRTKRWPGWPSWLGLVIGTALVLLGIILAARLLPAEQQDPPDPQKHVRGHELHIGSSQLPAQYVLMPTKQLSKIGGYHYGYPIRKSGLALSVPLVSLSDEEAQLSSAIDLSGRKPIYLGEVPAAKPAGVAGMVLVNPEGDPPDYVNDAIDIHVIWGAFRGRGRRAWKAVIVADNFHLVPGAADYLPEWPKALKKQTRAVQGDG